MLHVGPNFYFYSRGTRREEGWSRWAGLQKKKSMQMADLRWSLNTNFWWVLIGGG